MLNELMMKQDFQSFHANLSALDDQAINPSANVSLEQLVDHSRRNLLKGGMGLAAPVSYTHLTLPTKRIV